MRFAQRTKAVLDVASTIAVIVAAGVVVWKLALSGRPSAPAAAAEDAQGLIEASQIRHVEGGGRLAIVEFSDFECPFCGEHARSALPEIKRKLVDPGRARYVAMHFPLVAIHRQAMQAAEAAECAARQGRFWEMHARLFDRQGQLSPSALGEHARALGLDAAPFERCLEQRETLAKVRADLSIGRRLGVSATPTIFLGTVRDDGSIELHKMIRGVATPALVEAQVAALSPQAVRR